VVVDEFERHVIESMPRSLAPGSALELVEPLYESLLRNSLRRRLKGLSVILPLPLDSPPPVTAAGALVDGPHFSSLLMLEFQFRQNSSSSKRQAPPGPLGWYAPGILPAAARAVSQCDVKPIRFARWAALT
jgi:hypothetical protein